MISSQEEPTIMNSLSPAMSSVSQSDRENRRLRILLLVLMLVELISVVVPRISSHWRSEFRFLPQILIGFSVLALIFTIHLASQHKLLREVSSALIVATSYAEKLEQLSVIDAPTQLFNRRYLAEVFNPQLKWLNRSGRSATLLLLEVLPNGQKAAAEEIAIEAAYILRSNFRGSDYLVRYVTNQFLVVLPDTDEQQAQIALCRLIDKVHHWNLANEKRAMVLRLALSTCLRGGNIWENLSELEDRIRDKSDPGVRTLSTLKPAAYESTDLRPQENLLQ